MKYRLLFLSTLFTGAALMSNAQQQNAQQKAKPEDTEFYTPVPPVVIMEGIMVLLT